MKISANMSSISNNVPSLVPTATSSSSTASSPSSGDNDDVIRAAITTIRTNSSVSNCNGVNTPKVEFVIQDLQECIDDVSFEMPNYFAR